METRRDELPSAQWKASLGWDSLPTCWRAGWDGVNSSHGSSISRSGGGRGAVGAESVGESHPRSTLEQPHSRAFQGKGVSQAWAWSWQCTCDVTSAILLAPLMTGEQQLNRNQAQLYQVNLCKVDICYLVFGQPAIAKWPRMAWLMRLW